MPVHFPGRVIDGITCYAPDIADSHLGYPAHGFDVTVEVEESSFWCRSRNRLVASLLTRHVRAGQSVRMLEIGCGTGNVLNALRRLPNLELVGSEVYLSGLRHARRRLPDVHFIQLDATEMPFEREFDVVGAFDVLEHIADDERVIANVHRALRDDGLFLITVPQYDWMWSELDELVHHQRRYAKSELAARLRRGGFVIDYLGSFVSTLFPLMALKRLLSRRTARDDARAALAEHVQLPALLNAAFDQIMRVDEALVRLGVALPFGGSLVAVARKT